MSTDVQLKKMNMLTEELQEVANQNTKVLESHQQFQNELSQFLREHDEHIRNFSEQFMLQVQGLKQEGIKITNEYRQSLHDLRDEWTKTLAFNKDLNVVQPQAL